MVRGVWEVKVTKGRNKIWGLASQSQEGYEQRPKDHWEGTIQCTILPLCAAEAGMEAFRLGIGGEIEWEGQGKWGQGTMVSRGRWLFEVQTQFVVFQASHTLVDPLFYLSYSCSPWLWSHKWDILIPYISWWPVRILCSEKNVGCRTRKFLFEYFLPVFAIIVVCLNQKKVQQRKKKTRCSQFFWNVSISG